MRWQPLTLNYLEDFMNGTSKTIPAGWKRGLVSAVPLAGLLAFSGIPHATAFHSISDYLYSGFTGPPTKALAGMIFIISIIGISRCEGREFLTAVAGAFASGAVLAAPFLMPVCGLGSDF
jgi:hypothetical protein